MAEPTDYDAVPLPDSNVKPLPEWSTDERRALLLRTCLQRGGPSQVNFAAFARQFDVHRATVARDDVEAIRDSLAAHAGGGEALLLEIRSAFNRTYSELLDKGEPEKAWRVAKDWAEFLGGLGGGLGVEQSPQRIDVTHEDRTASASYEVVDEDSETGEADVITASDLRPELPDRDGSPYRVDNELE